MYLYQDLKPCRAIENDWVPCPVKGCTAQVPRQRGHFRKADEFCCKDHGICISPSTHEHLNADDNFLFPGDLNFLKASFKAKRDKHRLGRERSEDAVTFNVFRPLERLGLLDKYLSNVTGMREEHLGLVYWSYSPCHRGVYPGLREARAAFGEEENRGSEPDLIAVGEKTLYYYAAIARATPA